jgi:lipoate-protein ligase A
LGKVEVFLEVTRGIIESCRIQGDFLGLTSVRRLEEQLESRPYQFHAIDEALSQLDLLPYLGGVTREQLLDCIFARAKGDTE